MFCCQFVANVVGVTLHSSCCPYHHSSAVCTDNVWQVIHSCHVLSSWTSIFVATHFDVLCTNLSVLSCRTPSWRDILDAATGDLLLLQVLLGKTTCTEKIDIYSYGVVLWEICAGEAPPGRQLRPLR